MFIYLFIHILLLLYSFIFHLSIYLLFIYSKAIYLFIYLSIYLFIYLSSHIFIYLSKQFWKISPSNLILKGRYLDSGKSKVASSADGSKLAKLVHNFTADPYSQVNMHNIHECSKLYIFLSNL